MTEREILNWVKANKMRPELAAGIFDISLSTLMNAKRGAKLTPETLEKIIKAIRNYEATKVAQKAG